MSFQYDIFPVDIFQMLVVIQKPNLPVVCLSLLSHILESIPLPFSEYSTLYVFFSDTKDFKSPKKKRLVDGKVSYHTNLKRPSDKNSFSY